MTIEERVAELERKNRRLTWMLTVAGGTVALLVVLAVASGMAPAGDAPLEIVTAREFRLVDAQGRLRAKLVTDKEGSGLVLADEKGQARASLAVKEEGPWLVLIDEKGKPAVTICDGNGGGGILEVFNPLGNSVVNVQANKENHGMVAVCDHNGEPKRALVGE
ncbi:MAG: hypothetical protein KKE86_14320 [Planctomycetes bacterium]|nr:hypothetical protein [Planctomycetota bacterium]MBU4400495.1 hypothetical protein [Planctomycetota bacterium]MCG2683088.1 hypothetical protein [Planctomycetales bacterium]